MLSAEIVVRTDMQANVVLANSTAKTMPTSKILRFFLISTLVPSPPLVSPSPVYYNYDQLKMPKTGSTSLARCRAIVVANLILDEKAFNARFTSAGKTLLYLARYFCIMREAITEALRVISRVLKDRDIEWVLVGSTSLALQGVNVDPKDIDILTDKRGAYEIAILLKEYEIQPVTFSRSELFASHFGKFNIQGVPVEIMGDLEILTDGSWVNVTADRLQSKHKCKIGDVEVPVSSLEKQLEFYKKSSRKKDAGTAEEIRRALQEKV
jgi:predicted nucleotidyltransferase